MVMTVMTKTTKMESKRIVETVVCSYPLEVADRTKRRKEERIITSYRKSERERIWKSAKELRGLVKEETGESTIFCVQLGERKGGEKKQRSLSCGGFLIEKSYRAFEGEFMGVPSLRRAFGERESSNCWVWARRGCETGKRGYASVSSQNVHHWHGGHGGKRRSSIRVLGQQY